MAKKILFTSLKGGTGVTACCIGVGRALADSGERTLIVDGDTKSGCGVLAGGCREFQVYTLADYEKSACRAKQTVIAHPQISNLHFMPSMGLQNAVAAADAVKDVDGLFDYILLDDICRELCDSAIIVTDPYLPSVKSADVCRSELWDSGIKNLGLIVNKLSASLILSGEIMTAREISALLRLDLKAAIPEDLYLPAGRWRANIIKAFELAAENITGKSKTVMNVMRGYGGLNGFFKRKMREKI